MYLGFWDGSRTHSLFQSIPEEKRNLSKLKVRGAVLAPLEFLSTQRVVG